MNRRMLAICLLLTMAFSISCGVAARVKARNEMEDSKMAYKACLQQNLDDPSKCEALKRAYDADLKAYRASRPVGKTISVEED